MNKQQLIRSLSSLNFTEGIDFSIEEDYNSIQWFALEPEEMPSEESLQIITDALEQQDLEAQIELERKEDINNRLSQLSDISLIIEKYLADKQELINENDSINLAGFESCEKLESSLGWSFLNIQKPTLEQLEELVTDVESEQTQLQRNEKLKTLRSMRDSLLLEVDVMINELVLELRSDKTGIIAYRQALMDLTDDYRYVNDANRAKAAIDSLDLNDIDWPTKP